MSLSKYGKKIANVKLFFFSVLWLMVLLTVGTIAQKDIGLYQAQEVYFSSWIVWFWGFVPTPGGQLTMGTIFIGLLAQLIFKTPLKKRTFGIFVTHWGALLLLLGGIITGYFSMEGNMVIDEGGSASFFRDFHKLELAVIDPSPKDHDKIITFSQGFLAKGETVKSSEFPMEIEILNFCKNCNYERRLGKSKTKRGFHGFAKNFKLKSIPLALEDSENRSGFTFRLKNSDKDGVYAIFEDMQINQSIHSGGKTYYIQLRHKHYNLPFKIELLDFDKTDYASTQMAKSYKSVVNLVDDKIKQRTVIQMNEPLRYKGYTLYQSSYIEGEKVDTTILSVVHNLGRVFPYISSIIICIGIVIHLLITSGVFVGRRKEEVQDEN